MSRFHCFHRLMFSFLLLCTGACGDTSTIPGTEIPDTEVNRSVVGAVERFRVSMVMRDAAGIMAATHESYYDTAGTDDPGDDVSFEELGPILRQRMAQLQSVRFTIDYLEVSVDKDRAVVRVWIDASFRMGLGEAVTTELGIEPDAKTESRYARMQDFNMFELVQEGDGWLITSGL